MIPPAFEYLRPKTVPKAVALLQQHGDEASILSGGQSLIPMILIVVTVLALGASLRAQSILENAPGPGFAGNSSCRLYFGVVRIEDVSFTATNTLHGMTEDQLRWWKDDGYKKAPGLCYVSATSGRMPDLKTGCSQCPPDWKPSFYWVVTRRSPVVHQDGTQTLAPITPTLHSTNLPGRMTTETHESPGPSGITQGRTPSPNLALGASATVYAANAPLVSSSGEDMHLFKVTKSTRSFTAAAKDFVHLDRDVLKEGVALIGKSVKR